MTRELQILTVLEAARYLKVHRETLYGLIEAGAIQASKIGGRWRMARAVLDGYLEKKGQLPAQDEMSGARHDLLATAWPGAGTLRGKTPIPKRVLVAAADPAVH